METKFGRRLNLRLYESHSLIYQSLTFFPEKKVVSASVNVKIQLVCNFVFFTKEFVSWSLLLFLLFDSVYCEACCSRFLNMASDLRNILF